MVAEIISIGDELLIGQVVNTNAAWMAAKLNEVGIDVKEIRCVSDNFDEIVRVLEQAGQSADLILLTGGLGPTRDDITKEVLCRYFKTHLVSNPDVLKDIEAFFQRKGLKINELNIAQALVPEGCEVIRNIHGTAPGLMFEKEASVFIAMPGIPYEMKYIMESHVLPLIKKRVHGKYILHRTVLTQGIGESFLADKINHWELQLPQYIKLAYLPSPGMVRLRLTARGNQELKLRQELNDQVNSLIALIPQYFWGMDDDKLGAVVGNILLERSMTLSTAESCTGGYLAHLITSTPGSSKCFMGSVTAYHVDIKKSLLAVDPEALEKYTPVSKQVAEQMAQGARQALKSDYAIATTGIAGPDGGSEENPVGTIWIAIATPEKVFSKRFQFGDNRERNIVRASMAALGMLRNELVL